MKLIHCFLFFYFFSCRSIFFVFFIPENLIHEIQNKFNQSYVLCQDNFKKVTNNIKNNKKKYISVGLGLSLGFCASKGFLKFIKDDSFGENGILLSMKKDYPKLLSLFCTLSGGCIGYLLSKKKTTYFQGKGTSITA